VWRQLTLSLTAAATAGVSRLIGWLLERGSSYAVTANPVDYRRNQTAGERGQCGRRRTAARGAKLDNFFDIGVPSSSTSSSISAQRCPCAPDACSSTPEASGFTTSVNAVLSNGGLEHPRPISRPLFEGMIAHSTT
jgi:hypothetical protein